MNAAELVKALGGRKGKARCPAHNDHSPSLDITEAPDGKLLVICRAGCGNADVWAALSKLGHVGVRHHGLARARESARSHHRLVRRDGDRRAETLAFWEASGPALHTPAQDYLACRGIVIQPPACIRYHADKNALVALVQDIDGTFSAIQRVYLTTDSRGTWKTGRFSLGPIKGGAVRLTPAAKSIQLCESVEDGLALLQMTGKPTWAVPGAGFMVDFEPPTSVSEVIVAPDHDKAGLSAIEKAVKANHFSHLKLRQLLPPPGMDWCDVLEDHDGSIAAQEEANEPQSWAERFCNGL